MLSRKSSVRSLRKCIFLVSLQLHKALHWSSYSKISSPAEGAMKKSEQQEQFLMPGGTSGVLGGARAMGLQSQGEH